jgi:hypothetical protein
MERVPSVIAVQWNATERSVQRTTPTPRRSSNSVTVPTKVACPTGSKSAGPVGSGGVTRSASVHDLRKGQLDDVGGPPVAQLGNQDIDLRFADHGLDREPTSSEELGHSRRAK